MLNPFPLKNKPFETFPHVGQMWPPYNFNSSQINGLNVWFSPLAMQEENTLRNIVQNNSNGTLVNSPTKTFDPNWGKALSFDLSSSQEVTGTLANSINSQPFSIVVIARTATASSGRTFFGVGENSGNSELLHLRFQSNTSIRFGMWFDDLTATVADIRNRVVHMVFTLDANRLQSIYENGVFINSRTASNLFLGTDVFAIGNWARSASNEYWTGDIFEVLIYNYALNSREIYNLFKETHERYQPQVPRFIMTIPAAGGLFTPYPSKIHPSKNVLLRM